MIVIMHIISAVQMRNINNNVKGEIGGSFKEIVQYLFGNDG